jgi:D-3-phosphoglycerate dehydrogenase
VAKRAAPFGLRLMAYDPFIEEMLISDHGVLPATLSEVLSQSDFLSMHAPARPECHHLLTEKHFKQMKPTAIFINTGRGPTVDEEALIKALQEKWIAGRGARRAGEGAAVAQQSAAADGERDAVAAQRLGLGTLR